MRQKFPTRMTSIEQALHDAFVTAKFLFEMHVTMFGRWQPDFVFSAHRLIVQADGDYWHSRPSAKKNDRAFNTKASKEGWAVLRFSETRIKSDLSSCVEAVASLIRKQAG